MNTHTTNQESGAPHSGASGDARELQRKAGVRMAVVLATVAAMFFFGIILRQALLAH